MKNLMYDLGVEVWICMFFLVIAFILPFIPRGRNP